MSEYSSMLLTCIKSSIFVINQNKNQVVFTKKYESHDKAMEYFDYLIEILRDQLISGSYENQYCFTSLDVEEMAKSIENLLVNLEEA